MMTKQLHLRSALIFICVLIASGCENTDRADQTGTTDQTSATDETSSAGQRSSPNTSATGQKSRLNNFVDWATYRGDKEGTNYSSLSQITTENVQSLEEVWTYDTRNLVPPGMSSNPIVIDGVMYFADSELNLVALDAATGEERWLFDPVGAPLRRRGSLRWHYERGGVLGRQGWQQLKNLSRYQRYRLGY